MTADPGPARRLGAPVRIRGAAVLLFVALGGCASLGGARAPELADAEPPPQAQGPDNPSTTPQAAQSRPPARRQPAQTQAQAQAQQRTALSASEVQGLLSGNSVYAGGSGWEFAALHRVDGTLAGRSWGNVPEETGAGSWRVETDGRYCRKWDNAWSGGEWGCFKVYREGATLQLERVSGAGSNGPMTLVQGNAYQL